MKQLHLIVPGLLGPFAGEIPHHIQSQLSSLEFNMLNKVLARAKLSVSGAFSDSYFQTLIQLVYPECEQSICQLMAKFDKIDISDGYFYRADPVHFKAESDHALLLGPGILAPQQDEAKQLIDCFNRHFQDDKLSLHASRADRWYLKSERSLSLSFSALDYALGRDIKHFLPEGDDALWWRKILNEAQMLFFQHEVTSQRESMGKLAINGLWLWDLKYQQNDLSFHQPTQLFTDDDLAIAIGQIASQSININIQSTKRLATEQTDEIQETAVAILKPLYDAVCYGDIDAWFDDLLQFNQGGFQHVMQLLSSKKIDSLSIHPCNGEVYNINRMDLLKFWKQGALKEQINRHSGQ